MKRILSAVVLFVLLILTSFALTKVGVPKAHGLGATAQTQVIRK
jgi:hypothetical protein